MTEPQPFGLRWYAACWSAFALAVLTATTPSAAGAEESATAPPVGLSEYLKATLPADAEKVISVLGEVRNPQSIPPEQGVTVTKAIELAGGFRDFANSRKVKVWKPTEGRYLTVDLRASLHNKPDAEDPLLRAGDVVIVTGIVCYFK